MDIQCVERAIAVTRILLADKADLRLEATTPIQAAWKPCLGYKRNMLRQRHRGYCHNIRHVLKSAVLPHSKLRILAADKASDNQGEDEDAEYEVEEPQSCC